MQIGFTCGAFDLCHAGHMLMFKEAREQCDFLVVGLHTDPSIDRPTKHKPIMSVEERSIILQGIRYIDKIVLYNTEEELLMLLKRINPDVRFIGADWEGKEYTGKELPNKVVFNSRNHNYSSSEIRKRVYEAQHPNT